MKRIVLLVLIGICALIGYFISNEHQSEEVLLVNNYTFPTEDGRHEGTWLNWPHHYTYGMDYRKKIEPIWIEMVESLHKGEKVHIIAYNEDEKQRIVSLLTAKQLDMTQIDFVVAKSDDVWSRDTGPMFVFDERREIVIVDFAFDGWGKKMPYKNDDKIPEVVAKSKSIPIVSIPNFILEGGSVELDGAGTLMATKSSVISKNRNQNMTMTEAEQYLSKYLGVTNFIWLEGVVDEDITDAHIDGMARFYDNQTLLTVSEDDFFELYEMILESDYEILLNATNANGKPYKIIELPLTSKNVQGLDYKGSYLNYYVGNDVVLLPIYKDENDIVASEIIEKLYSNKKIVTIDVTELYKYGGMLHCITQQQPRQAN